MGSRIMHYCISVIINQQLNLDPNRFLVGGIAPDVHHLMGERDKKESHFMVKNSLGVGRVDYERFIDNYSKSTNDPFFLGYFSHLISDDIWLKNIYYRHIKWLPPEEKKIAQQKNYRDFQKLNRILIERYSLTFNMNGFIDVHIDEIDANFLPEMVKDVQNDFNYDCYIINEPLELLVLDEIIQFIDESVDVSIREIKKIVAENA